MPVQKSTGLRWNDPDETRKAKQLKLDKIAEEGRFKGTSPQERFSEWCQAFIEDRYSHPITRELYRRSLYVILTFLEKRGIFVPRQVTYNHLIEFVKWRQAPDDPTVGACGRNTAIDNLKILRVIMREALRRGFCESNPCSALGLKMEKPKEKPEITEDEIKKIRAALASGSWPAWMSPCFEIAIHQGCRLMETRIPMTDISIEKGTITFDAKGDNKFTTALHPELVPMMRKLKQEGREHTLEWSGVRPSIYWSRFFRKNKLKHLCFHCTRVTVITRLARAGVPISQAMRFVGHASQSIHQIYQRLQVDDLSACVGALKMSP